MGARAAPTTLHGLPSRSSRALQPARAHPPQRLLRLRLAEAHFHNLLHARGVGGRGRGAPAGPRRGRRRRLQLRRVLGAVAQHGDDRLHRGSVGRLGMTSA